MTAVRPLQKSVGHEVTSKMPYLGSVISAKSCGQRRITGVIVTGLCLMALFAINGCGKEDKRTNGAVTFLERPVAWHPVRVQKTTGLVRVASSVGYCAGGPQPRYGHIVVRQRGSRIYVKPFGAFPRPATPNGKGACGGVGLLIHTEIHLGHSLDGHRLIDAGVNPPQQRWPGGGS